MRGLWNLFQGISFGLGKRRVFVRRLASIALVLLGVHAAAHTMDATFFSMLDRIDLAFDQLVWATLEQMGQLGAISSDAALDYSERFSEAINLEEKEFLAHALSLGAELLTDFLLLDLVWGTRVAMSADDSGLSAVDELKRSTQVLKDAIWPLDLERFAAPLVLLFFTLAGALSTGLAVEGALHNLVSSAVPLWRWSINLAAACGLLSVALLMLRFLPDLLFGGTLRASERSRDAKTKAEKKAATKALDPSRKSLPTTRIARFREKLPFLLRGWSVAFVLLPLSLVALITQETFLQLVQRTGAGL